MSADKDRGIRRQKQKRAKQLKRQAREVASGRATAKNPASTSGRSQSPPDAPRADAS